MNVPLLMRLREAGGAFVPAEALGNDPEALAHDLDDLDAFGFALERHPRRGVAYRGPSGRLCPDLIAWGLEGRRIGSRVEVWDRVGSTNDVAARALRSSSGDGLVVLAEAQTAGRGRRGRTWRAPSGSAVLASAAIVPPASLDDPAWLTALGAVATAEVVGAWTGLPSRIKWPNDVRVGGRKIAGILVERGAGAVVGIGLNVNADHDDFPPPLRESATSLRMLLGEPVDRSEVARSLICALDDRYAEGLAWGADPLHAAWRARMEGMGERVRLVTASGSVAGRLVDASLQDGLVIETDLGSWVQVRAAEVVSLAPAT